MSQMRRHLIDPNCVFAEHMGDLQRLRDMGYTIGGKPTVVDSPWGKALNFNSANSDYVSLGGANGPIDVESEFTISIGARINTGSKDNMLIQRIDGVAEAGYVPFMLRVDANNDLDCFESSDDASWGTLISNVGDVTVGEWFDVSVTHNGANTLTTVYQNGVSVGSDASAANPFTGVSTFLGVDESVYMDASIAYLIITKRAWSAQECLNMHLGRFF